MAKWAVSGFATALACAAQADTSHRVVATYVANPPQIDGVLDEWQGVSGIVIDGPSHMWEAASRGGWVGSDDLSARFLLSYDRNHLYVAGVIRDDGRVLHAPGQLSEQADVIELFFNTDLEDDAAAPDGDPVAFSEDDTQVFLLPLSPRRPWEVKAHGAAEGVGSAGTQWTGMRLAHSDQPPLQYSFEAQIPLHRLPGFEPGVREIGFTVCVGDWDPQRPGRYAYMTWNGRNPVSPQDTRQMGRLVFGQPSDPAPLSLMPGASGLTVPLGDDLPYVLIPLGLLVVVVLGLRWWLGARDRLRPLRPALRIGGVVLLLAAFLVPALWGGVRNVQLRSDLGGVTEALQSALPSMEGGTLASYLGPGRDQALSELLEGRSVARQKYLTYRPLVDVLDEGFGPPKRTFPGDFFRVMPYWLPLPEGDPESLEFPRPLDGQTVHCVVAWPYSVEPAEANRPVPSLAVAPETRDGPEEEQVLTFDSIPEFGDVFGRAGYAVAFQTVRLPEECTGLTLTALDHPDLQLVGLTLASDTDETGVPLMLGQVSSEGVETDLRGPYPLAAGVDVRRGDTVSVEIPGERRVPYQRLWLFYRATHPGPEMPMPTTGATVARVQVFFSDRRLAPRVIEFQHQESMFFEYSKHNDTLEPAPESGVAVAFDWTDEGEERLQNFVKAVTLPERAVVERVEFEGFAPYSVRFRSLVFGSEKQAAPQDGAESPLTQGETTRDRVLRPEVLERLGAARIAIFRDGRFSAGARCDEASWGGIPRPVAARLAAGEPLVEHEVGGEEGQRWFQSYYRLTGDGWDGAVLGVSLLDSGHAAAIERSYLVSLILALLATPLLMVFFSEMLTVLNNLRLRLMVVLAVATLLPLAVLSFVLVRVLEGNHAAGEHRSIRAELATTLDQLDEQQSQLVDGGRQWLDGLADEYVKWRDVPGASLEQLRNRMASLLPEAWDGGFLRLEFEPEGDGEGFQIVTGDTRAAASDTPLRTDPGLYVFWGQPMIGARVERVVSGGNLGLSVGRPMARGLLNALAPGQSLLLADMEGYPIDAADGGVVPRDGLLARAIGRPAMEARRGAIRDATDTGPPSVWRARSGGDALLVQEVLRDQQGTPRALLSLSRPWRRASLELAFGTIPVRAFFLAVGGLLLILAVFVSTVVTARITRPIERLERGAQAISRGDLAVRVDEDEGGQIGRLTRTFNQMAQDLQSQLQDLRLLYRAIRAMNSRLDVDQTLAVVLAYYEQHSPADRVRVILLDRARGEAALHGGGDPEPVDTAELGALLEAQGPFCTASLPGALAASLPHIQSCLALPLVVGGVVRGAALLCFEAPMVPEVDLELLSTMAAQSAVALENAWLYQQAVLEPGTEAMRADAFRREVADRVARADARDEVLVLASVRLRAAAELPESEQDDVLRWLADRLRREFDGAALLGYGRVGELLVADRGGERRAAEAAVASVRAAWRQHPLSLGMSEHHVLEGRVVAFPEDAASGEFLFGALGTESPAATEPDEAGALADGELEGVGVFARSPAMRAVYRTLRRVAPTDLTVLIEGETGVGKEVLADLLHSWCVAERAAGPLVKVHCAALSPTLLESELFGHEKGAFTGAVARKIGRFEQAEGGTLFLDEIGEVSPEVQVKLLRVLQQREIERVGGREPIPVDVRIVAATHRDLRGMANRGEFREDLFFRLQGMVLEVPPLRERREEIPLLADLFRREAVEAGQSRAEGFSTGAMDELYRRDWPGNVRELRNVVQRAVVLARGSVVDADDLTGEGLSRPAESELPVAAGRNESPDPPAVQPADGSATRVVVPSERVAQAEELADREGSFTTVQYAELVGISRRTGLRDLQEMVQLGVLERLGKRRGARYRRPAS